MDIILHVGQRLKNPGTSHQQTIKVKEKQLICLKSNQNTELSLSNQKELNN